MLYKIKRHEKMREIFTAHANRRSTTLDFLRFLLDGERVHEDQTSNSLNLAGSSKVDCVLAQGVSATLWLADLNGNSWASCLALKYAVFENTPPLAWKQNKTEQQRSDLRRCPQQHPEPRLSPRKPFPFEALAARTEDRQTQQRKATTSKEVSEARALWRAGKVTKPEHAQFCNQIHLLELQASKGDMDGGRRRQEGQTDTASGSGRKREKRCSTQESRIAHNGTDKGVPGYCQTALCPRTQA